MRRIIELNEQDISLSDEILKLLNAPEVRKVFKKRGYIDLRMPIDHYHKILKLLIPEDGEA